MRHSLLCALRTIFGSTMIMSTLVSSGFAQTADIYAKPITDADVQLLRQDLQSLKNQIISDTMNLNDKEISAFWPIYKEYAAAQHSIAAKRLAVISDYARNLDKMTDSTARTLTDRMFAVESETQSLRKEYLPRFEKALGAKRAAKFYQVDNRLTLMVNLQLASEIPLIP